MLALHYLTASAIAGTMLAACGHSRGPDAQNAPASERAAPALSPTPESARADTTTRAAAGEPSTTPARGADSTAAATARARPLQGGSPPAAGATGSAPAKRIRPPAGAPSTSTPAEASPEAPSAPAATGAGAGAGAGAEHGPGGVVVNKFLSYNAGTKMSNIKLFAAYNSAQGGFNFNGGSGGNQTITVPADWTVNIDVTNLDAIPHSAIVIADQTPIPSAPSTPAIPRAYTSHLTDGLPPQNGHDTMNFKASQAGNYLIACGVPGHALSGMYIKFVVSATATAPTYTGVVPSR